MEGIQCVIDWPGTANFFKDVVVACAAIFTARVAYVGIHKWRNEEAGKADFDLARRVGKSVFRMRDVLINARRPFIMAYEFPEDFDPSDKGKKEAEAYARLYDARFLPVNECAIEIQALCNEVEALWGSTPVALLNKLLTLATTLRVAQQTDIRDKSAYGSHFGNNPAFGASVQKRVLDTGAEINPDGTEGAPNALTVEIGDAVDRVTEYLRTKLPTK